MRRQIAEQYRLARYYRFDTRAIKAAMRTRADPSGAIEHLALIERCFEVLGAAKREPKLEFPNGNNENLPERAIRGP